jgi:HTH-type transcriptional regulator / antitoxin MqsA
MVKEKCAVCGKGELVQETKSMPYTYKGQQTRLEGIAGLWCQSCGEVFLKGDEIDLYMEAAGEFKKQVNAGLVDPVFIARVRKKLGMDQRQAARYFGGGVNAFSMYETGKATPPVALVRFFQMLDRHPELVNEIKEEETHES